MHRPLLASLAILALLPTAAAATEVKALGGFFSPDALQVAAGEEVVWTNEDSMPHTVTSTWDAGKTFDAVLRGGESFSWTFSEVGEFIVHCRPHAYPNEDGSWEGMAMTIAVVPEGAGSIGGPVNETPAPALPLLIVGLLGAATLLRRRA
ncbi:MAG TPA: plastocyanin/azurin family copper-binding protein [Candidatus Thermoplasmatota archaeon]|nr:plastocyanin/azurin family copper-binding protein [Candidatus Thermoplasmatota archaeon]